ncbi:MAG: serine/threonine-protein kinase [Acidobacteriia bacterium]|nr:serine/threonine-protein kinase [Terriglobia bacterium]
MERCSTCGEPLELGELCGVCLLAQGISPSELPDWIGRYRIVRLLGEGGMGAVFEAEQDLPRRTVALKVIRTGLVTPEALRRFQKESQALARLQHPGIAQIYEAGTADYGYGPQPYFAMEFIQGQPLDQYVGSHRLDTRQRLELMIKVCEAVHHAHERGIVHRDLKPGNILVDADGQPKILDFGVARITDPGAAYTRQTDMGQLLVTVAYMSPEQVLGDPLQIDARSDVYTLGVILYQTLAGRLPYAVTRELHHAVQVIREQDPSRLSSVSRIYRGDIETIAGKALEKDKSRRYASAAGLAGDLRRYLEHQPIIARRPSAAYQLQKFARRHRAVVAGVLGVFLALVAGIVASTTQASRARLAEQAANRERDRAVAAQFKAEQASSQAAASEARARKDRDDAVKERNRADVEAATAQAVNDFLQKDLLAQASNQVQAGPGARPDPDIKIRTALDRAAARIDGKFDNQPLVEASIRQTIGESYEDLGLLAEAQRQLERVVELRRRTLGFDDPRTMSARQTLGEIFQYQGKYPQAEQLFSSLLAAQRRALGNRNPETLRTLTRLGMAYWFQKKFALAEPLFKEALQGQLKALGAENPATLQTMQAIGMLYTSTARYAEAEQTLARVIEISRRVHGEERPFSVASMNNLANLYRAEKKYPQAEQMYLAVHEIQLRVRGEAHPNSLNTMSSLASTYLQAGKDAEAEKVLAKLVEIAPRALGDQNVITLWSITNLADLYRSQGKYAQAEPLWSRLLAARQSGRPPNTAALANLSYVRIMLEKYAGAEAAIREGLASDEQAAPDSWQVFRDRVLLGASLAGQLQYAEAEPLLRTGYEGLLRREGAIPKGGGFYADAARDWLIRLDREWSSRARAAK